MARTLTVVFSRDPSRDRQRNQIRFEGYRFYWPDGRPVAVGLDAFCTNGQKLLGLSRHLHGRKEQLLELLCFPLRSREDRLTRLPGQRVRRFMLRRQGRQGRVYFIDGTPTELVFDLNRDERGVLRWIGLAFMKDGEDQWFDLTARVAGQEPVSVPALAAEGIY